MTAAAETAVRNYLLWLRDPESLRDENAISDLRSKVDAATDPVEELRLRSELRRASEVDGTSYRNEFVAQARSWAEENGVSLEAFREMGVPNSDLRDAGLAGSPNVRGVAGGNTGRRTRVSPEAIRASVPSGTFSARDLEAASGASTATVRKVINSMIDDGQLIDLGPDPQWGGRGRAPVLYRIA